VTYTGHMKTMWGISRERRPGNRRAGRIRARLIAIILLGFGISLLLSAERSISRQFSGFVLEKGAHQEFGQGFWLRISAPVTELTVLPPPDAEGVASGPGAPWLLDPLRSRRVGVSRFIHKHAVPMQTIQKVAYSPFIFLDGERHIDLGVQWLLWGLLSIIIAALAYRRALQSPHHPPIEEVAVEDPDLA
jgi:hypothetical protein